MYFIIFLLYFFIVLYIFLPPVSYNLFVLICAVGLSVLRPLLAYCAQPRMIGDGDCGEIGGMKIGRGNRSSRRKPAPAPLSPPHIPHDQTRV
jgi:hypothetical protein